MRYNYYQERFESAKITLKRYIVNSRQFIDHRNICQFKLLLGHVAMILGHIVVDVILMNWFHARNIK